MTNTNDNPRKITTFEWALLAVPVIAAIAYCLGELLNVF